jgi:hypothetical protein
MSLTNEISDTLTEIKNLKLELMQIAKELKDNPDSHTRKKLIEERKQVQFDLEEAERHLVELKQLPDNIDDIDEIADESIEDENPNLPDDATDENPTATEINETENLH